MTPRSVVKATRLARSPAAKARKRIVDREAARRKRGASPDLYVCPCCVTRVAAISGSLYPHRDAGGGKCPGSGTVAA